MCVFLFLVVVHLLTLWIVSSQKSSLSLYRVSFKEELLVNFRTLCIMCRIFQSASETATCLVYSALLLLSDCTEMQRL